MVGTIKIQKYLKGDGMILQDIDLYNTTPIDWVETNENITILFLVDYYLINY